MHTIPPAADNTGVTVLGLGPMGQAMVRCFLSAGHRVSVWNRTPGRAAAIVEAGAELSPTPAEAVGASELVIVSLTDYQMMMDVLANAAGALSGKTLVNLSSDTPDATRAARDWAESHSASFLAGGIMVPAPMLGSERAYVYYSGNRTAFERHQQTLACIGEPRYLGEDPGRAQLMYQAHLDVFLTSLAGLAHAVALAGSAGIRAQAFLPDVMHLFRAIPDMIAPDGAGALGARIDADEHPGARSTANMLGATADHVQAASAAAGIDTKLPRAVQACFRRTIDRGHGTDGWTRIIDSIRDPRVH